VKGHWLRERMSCSAFFILTFLVPRKTKEETFFFLPLKNHKDFGGLFDKVERR
jgi:hypothetical protein